MVVIMDQLLPVLLKLYYLNMKFYIKHKDMIQDFAMVMSIYLVGWLSFLICERIFYG